MSFTMPSNIEVQDSQATQFGGQEGAVFRYAYSTSLALSLPAGSQVDTIQHDFGSYSKLGVDQLRAMKDKFLAFAEENGSALVTMVVWESVLFDVVVPREFCVSFLGIRECFTPPFAGQSLVTSYAYRVWFVTVPRVGALAVRPFVWAAQVILALVALIYLTWPTIVGGIQVLLGRTTYESYRESTPDPIEKTGEHIEEAAKGAGSGAFIGLGLVMIAGGLLVPMAMSSTARVQAGPVQVDTTLGTREPRAPARRR